MHTVPRRVKDGAHRRGGEPALLAILSTNVEMCREPDATASDGVAGPRPTRFHERHCHHTVGGLCRRPEARVTGKPDVTPPPRSPSPAGIHRRPPPVSPRGMGILSARLAHFQKFFKFAYSEGDDLRAAAPPGARLGIRRGCPPAEAPPHPTPVCARGSDPTPAAAVGTFRIVAPATGGASRAGSPASGRRSPPAASPGAGRPRQSALATARPHRPRRPAEP